MEKLIRHFKVASVSSNKNSFGLTGMYLMDKNGNVYEVGVNSLHVKAKGDILNVPMAGKEPDFSSLGYEIPTFIGAAPPAAIDEIWGTVIK